MSWRMVIGLFYCKTRCSWKRCLSTYNTLSALDQLLFMLYFDCKTRFICSIFIHLCSSVNVHFLHLLILMLLLSGDVESNPGPRLQVLTPLGLSAYYTLISEAFDTNLIIFLIILMTLMYFVLRKHIWIPRLRILFS